MNTNTLTKRVKFGQSVLSPYLSGFFTQFGDWLVARRGVQFAATHIQNYFQFFLELDKFSLDCAEIPSYKSMVKQFTVAMTRKNLLVTIFLDEIGVISVEKSIKNDYSSLDSIERYLRKFESNSTFSKYLNHYFNLISAKLCSGKTSVRSIRLALTPAVKLLESCQYFNIDFPTNELLYAFLWVSPGQRASITGFINFLNHSYQLGLVIPERKDIIIHRHKLSHAQLKQRLILLLREPKYSASYKGKLMTVSLAYFHRVSIPKLVCNSSIILKKNCNGDYYVQAAGEKFYIPYRCVQALL
jgi:hypothetical protein